MNVSDWNLKRTLIICKHDSHIVNHMKILRCLNSNWQPKVTTICEYRDLETMSMYTIFGKLQEHEIKLKRLSNEEEGYKKKRKSIVLKDTNIKDMESKYEEC